MSRRPVPGGRTLTPVSVGDTTSTGGRVKSEVNKIEASMERTKDKNIENFGVSVTKPDPAIPNGTQIAHTTVNVIGLDEPADYERDARTLLIEADTEVFRQEDESEGVLLNEADGNIHRQLENVTNNPVDTEMGKKVHKLSTEMDIFVNANETPLYPTPNINPVLRKTNHSHSLEHNKVVDQVFFRTLKVDRNVVLTSLAEVPLSVCVFNEDEIGVRMLLESSESAMQKDSFRRTPVHIACLKSSVFILQQLLESYRWNAVTVADSVIRKLQKDMEQSMIPFISGHRKGNVTVVRDWFMNEIASVYRQVELRSEVWWLSIMRSRDDQGRTPLHYAVGCNAPLGIIKTVLGCGRGRLCGADHRRIEGMNFDKSIARERDDATGDAQLAARIRDAKLAQNWAYSRPIFAPTRTVTPATQAASTKLQKAIDGQTNRSKTNVKSASATATRGTLKWGNILESTMTSPTPGSYAGTTRALLMSNVGSQEDANVRRALQRLLSSEADSPTPLFHPGGLYDIVTGRELVRQDPGKLSVSRDTAAVLPSKYTDRSSSRPLWLDLAGSATRRRVLSSRGLGASAQDIDSKLLLKSAGWDDVAISGLQKHVHAVEVDRTAKFRLVDEAAVTREAAGTLSTEIDLRVQSQEGQMDNGGSSSKRQIMARNRSLSPSRQVGTTRNPASEVRRSSSTPRPPSSSSSSSSSKSAAATAVVPATVYGRAGGRSSDSRLGAISGRALAVDYEVVVPWVLRSLLKRATEIGARRSFDGIEMLEELLNGVEAALHPTPGTGWAPPSSPSPSSPSSRFLAIHRDATTLGVLVVPELRVFLGRLGIRVTTDVLAELCRRYPADASSIEEKWEFLAEQRSEYNRVRAARRKYIQDEDGRAAKAGQSRGRHRRGRRQDSKSDIYPDDDEYDFDEEVNEGKAGQDADDVSYYLRRPSPQTSQPTHAEEKSSSGQQSSHRGSKGGRYSSSEEDDSDADGEDDCKGGASVLGTTFHVSTAFQLDSSQADTKGTRSSVPLPPLDISLDERDYNNLGLDIRKLFSDIKSGRGLQAIHFSETQRRVVRQQSRANEEAWLQTLKKCNIDDELLDILRGDNDTPGPEPPVQKGLQSSDLASLRSAYNHVHSSAAMAERPLPECATISHLMQVRKTVIDIRDSFGRTPLMIASALGNVELVSWLMGEGADISVCTSEGHSAVSLASTPAVRNVLEKALVGWMSRGDGSRLYERAAAQESREGCSRGRRVGTAGDKQPTGAGEPVPAGSAGISSLVNHSGELMHRTFAMSKLISQLPKLQNQRWAFGKPPLSWAVKHGLPTAVTALLASGADPNTADAVGRRPLHECVALLMQTTVISASDQADDDKYGGYLLDHQLSSTSPASGRAAIAIAEALLSAGADVNAVSVSGRSALLELFCSSSEEALSTSLVSLSGTGLSTGIYTGSQTRAGGRAGTVFTQSRLLMLKKLIHWGADPAQRDRSGQAAVHYCVREDNVEALIEILASSGSSSGDDGPVSPARVLTLTAKQSPLHTACKSGSQKCAQLLCRWDADARMGHGLIELEDGQGRRPVHLLRHTAEAGCLDTLWDACRRGDALRTAELLNSIKTEESYSEPLFALQPVDGEDHEKDAHRDEDGDTQAPQSRGQSVGRLEWMKCGIDTKSRRLRWTGLHACIIGWAERAAGVRVRAGETNLKSVEHTRGIRGQYEWGKRTQYSFSDPLRKQGLIRSKDSMGNGDVGSGARLTRINTCAERALSVGASVSVSSSTSAASSVGRSGSGSGVNAGPQSTAANSSGCRRSGSGGSPGPNSKSPQLFQYTETLRLLLQSFAFVDSIECNGRTPLHLAAACNLPAACFLLLSAGADVNSQDLDGNTPLHLAYAFGSEASVSVLEGSVAEGGTASDCETKASDLPNATGRLPFDCIGLYDKIAPIFPHAR